MDEKEIRAKIEALAIIEDRRVAQVNIRSKKQEEEGLVFPEGENPTLGFDLVKIRSEPRACRLNCGDLVTDQVIEHRLGFTPIRHWKTRCANCQKYVHPNGVDLIKGGHEAQRIYNIFYKKNQI